LTKLSVHKNSKGEPHCPVLFKVFNNNSHIVAIKNTGNVFSYEVKSMRHFRQPRFLKVSG
jgi:hypothetical protein